MIKKFGKSAVLLAMALACSGAFAGPFGIDMGMSLDDLAVVCGSPPREIAPGFYAVTPPTPHPSFDAYVVQVSPSYGVHFIKAIGTRVETSAYGEGIRIAFEDAVTALEKTYGKGEILDYLLKDSTWSREHDWMMSLVKKERILLAFWQERKNDSYPGNIASIGVMATADSTVSGFVVIEYYSRDNDAAQDESAEDSVF